MLQTHPLLTLLLVFAAPSLIRNIFGAGQIKDKYSIYGLMCVLIVLTGAWFTPAELVSGNELVMGWVAVLLIFYDLLMRVLGSKEKVFSLHISIGGKANVFETKIGKKANAS